MTPAPERSPIEPLFAHSARLWLRVWATAQGIALVVGCIASAERLASPRAIAVVALLVAYHALGFRAYAWLMRHPWALAAFVPLGWFLVLQSLSIHGAFALLVVGAVIQGFVFLPFGGAIAALALVVGLLVWSVTRTGPWTSLTTARVAGIVAIGAMIGTVLLYIHRANRDAAIRNELLARLDAAQRDLAARAREAGVQEERQRIARDIHDTLAQGFTSVIKHLEAIELSADPLPDATRAHLAHARDVSRTSLGEIRRLVWALRPSQLDDAPLAAAIARIVQQWGDANGIATTCTTDVLPPLDPDAEVAFLRATQEALSNVARHADASSVSVALHSVDGLVMLVVEDDGHGFVESEALGGVGLAGMRERVRPLGGHVIIESAPGEGTSVTVAMPLSTVVRT